MKTRNVADNIRLNIRHRMRELRAYLTQNPNDWTAHDELASLARQLDEVE